MSDDEDLRGLDDPAFDALEDEVERLATENERGLPADGEPQPKSDDSLDPAHSEADFEQIVRQAVDELPSEYQRALEGVAIVVRARAQLVRRVHRPQARSRTDDR